MSVASLKGLAISRNERGRGESEKGENGLAPMIREVFFLPAFPRGNRDSGWKTSAKQARGSGRTTSFVRRVHLHNEIISFCPRMEP